MDRPALEKLFNPFDQVVIDIGTGDGLFVYRSALANPNKFFVGLDANARPLEKISEKIYRKTGKGGAPNALFVQAAAEDLPSELDGIASELHANFPWGSLLSAVAGGNAETLQNLRRICAPDALLKIVIGFDEAGDRTEIERLQLPSLSLDYVNTRLALYYQNAGFELVEGEIGKVVDVELETTWARRLRANTNRSFVKITARVIACAED